MKFEKVRNSHRSRLGKTDSFVSRIERLVVAVEKQNNLLHSEHMLKWHGVLSCLVHPYGHLADDPLTDQPESARADYRGWQWARSSSAQASGKAQGL